MRQGTFQFLFGDCRSSYFHSLIKSTLLVRKGLLCLCDGQNYTWLLVDMKFLFSCSTRHLSRSLRSLVGYRVKHSKRNTISTCAHLLLSIYHSVSPLIDTRRTVKNPQPYNERKLNHSVTVATTERVTETVKRQCLRQ